MAHPDRYFHSMNNWTEEDEQFKEQIFLLAKEKNIKSEKNLSVYEKNGYNMNFWGNMPEEIQLIYGLDAHSLKDMERRLVLCKNTILKHYCPERLRQSGVLRAGNHNILIAKERR